MPTFAQVSETYICNLALRKVGAPTIKTIEVADTSEPADLCRLFYPQVRDAVLSMYPWKCAMARAQLVASATAPAFGFSNQFPLPNGSSSVPYCLRVLRMNDQSWEYKIEGRMLLTNASTVQIVYTGRIAEPTQYGQLLIQALYTSLAAEISTSMKQSTSFTTSLIEQVENVIIPMAYTTDAQQNSMELMETTDFLEARLQTNGTVVL